MALCIRCGTFEGKYSGYVNEIGLKGTRKIKGKLCKGCMLLQHGYGSY